MIIPAFHGSANEFNALSIKSKNACVKAPNTLNPVRFKINPPDKTPINNEMTTFLVINANTIATIGGINVNSPNLSALLTAGSTPAAKTNVVDNINSIIVKPKILLKFLFIHCSSLNIYMNILKGTYLKTKKSLELTLKACNNHK